MTTLPMKRAAAAAFTAALSLPANSAAYANIADYEFQLVQTDIKQVGRAIISVRLVHRQSGAAVPNAVIFTTRIDMAPDGMATMTAPIEALPSTEAGIYRFTTNLTMAGRWRLSLAAKIQGETGTLESRLTLVAIP